jgi:hypothetical protein
MIMRSTDTTCRRDALMLGVIVAASTKKGAARKWPNAVKRATGLRLVAAPYLALMALLSFPLPNIRILQCISLQALLLNPYLALPYNYNL